MRNQGEIVNFGFTLFFRNPPPAKVSLAELCRKEI
jgi:hypothetical protein